MAVWNFNPANRPNQVRFGIRFVLVSLVKVNNFFWLLLWLEVGGCVLNGLTDLFRVSILEQLDLFNTLTVIESCDYLATLFQIDILRGIWSWLLSDIEDITVVKIEIVSKYDEILWRARESAGGVDEDLIGYDVLADHLDQLLSVWDLKVLV